MADMKKKRQRRGIGEIKRGEIKRKINISENKYQNIKRQKIIYRK